ncbi:DMT family transporter [Eikenella sp. S3360]|uniref:DMT family transporter n=1 Tax=Eikenella glucosivorans TaxID=2766967 RepID=A0ABS0N7G9_9NEIS|nr:DMT family transporter [Eikenella glucosivorans]
MKHYSVYLKLLGMAVLWGASWPMGRMLGQSLPPLTGGALRFLLASVLLLGWLFARSRLATLAVLSARQWLGLAAAAAFGVCGYAVFFMLGLQQMPAGKAAVVVAVNPVLTLLLAAWLFGERLNLKILAGMLLAVGGAVTAVTQGHPSAVLTGGIKAGEWLIFGCVVCWAAYTLIGRAVLRGIDALTVTAATSLIGALMLSAVALFAEGLPFAAIAAMDARGWAALAGLAVGATVLAYAWYFEGVKTLGAGSAAAYITLVPIFGMLCSAWFLGEALHISLVAGCAAAVGGMALMQYGQK